jgi:hypothetical protein
MNPTPTSDVLVTTRESWHRVGEHVLAATRKRATGEITLVAGPGGFRTPVLPDGTVLAVVGAELSVSGPDGERRAPLRTLSEASAFAGVQPGFPWSTHPPATPFEPDAPLRVDLDAARVLAEWYALGHETLTTLLEELPGPAGDGPQIFPEHFDLAVTAAGINFGFSPGDESIPLPYVYVGPHVVPSTGDFWNAPFGAYRTHEEVTTRGQALAFLRAGRAAVAG